MTDLSDLGTKLFECEKYPAKICFKNHSGGWAQVALQLIFFGPMIAIFPTGLVLAGLEKSIDEQMWLPWKQVVFWSVLVGMTLLVIFLFIIYFRRGYTYGEILAIALYQNGIVITRPNNQVCKKYDEIRDIYFGTRSQAYSTYLSIGKYLHRGFRMAEIGMRQRLTVEFHDGTIVKLGMLFCFFPEDSIAKLFDHIASRRPDLFAEK